MQNEGQSVSILKSKHTGRRRAMFAPWHMPGLEVARGIFADERY